jgi:Predicted integral membrane protein
MASQYLFAKLLHIFIAVVALGTSAGLGIVLEFFGSHPIHGSFVLRAIARVTWLVVLPGYVLMLATGVWLVSLSWSFTANWIQCALALWVIGVLPLASSLLLLGEQRQALDTAGPTSASYQRISRASRVVGGSFGLVVVLIIGLMVFKPWS